MEFAVFSAVDANVDDGRAFLIGEASIEESFFANRDDDEVGVANVPSLIFFAGPRMQDSHIAVFL